MHDLIFDNIGIITDAIIALIAVLSGWVFFRAVRRVATHTARRARDGVLVVFSTLSIVLIIYGTLIEPSTIAVREYDLDLETYSGKTVTFAVISDLHVGRFDNSLRFYRAVQKIKELDPSYVLILGDVVNSTDKHGDTFDVLREQLPSAQIFFVYGNHDYTEYDDSGSGREIVAGLTQKLEDLEVEILSNESLELDEGIILSGITDLWSKDYDLSYLHNIPSEEPHILLSHNPDVVHELSEGNLSRIDLVVAGHTHGGEVRIPGIGAFYPLPTELPDTYDQGLFEYSGTKLLITSGTGSVGTRIKIANPPELLLLNIN